MFNGFDSKELPEIDTRDGINRIPIDVFKHGVYRNIVNSIPSWIVWVLIKLKIFPRLVYDAFEKTFKEY